jgi:hypothetical protein
MAKAQALFVANPVEMSLQRLTAASDWTQLSNHLREIGWTEQHVCTFETLVKAHKPSITDGPIAILKTAIAEITAKLDDMIESAGDRSSSHCQSSPNPTPAPDC